MAEALAPASAVTPEDLAALEADFDARIAELEAAAPAAPDMGPVTARLDDFGARLEALEGAEINDAKVRLANEATTLLHGADAAREAEATARQTFAGGGAGDALPTVTFDMSDEAVTLVGLFVEAGLAGSNGEVRRHMKAGAAKVNDAPLTDPFARPTADLVVEGAIKLSVGKKRHALAKPA